MQSATPIHQDSLVRIEEVPLGARVRAKNPKCWDYDATFAEPKEESWARFNLTAKDKDGSVVDAEFIRPRWWMNRFGIQAGASIPMVMEELGLSGHATIVSVDDCSPIATGEGNVVTGRFTTRRVDAVARLEILGPYGEEETIEGTTIHPVWSIDRNDWTPLADLRPGERLQGKEGVIQVLSVTIAHCCVPVYNIEVHGEHVYQVGELGLLVHNTCTVIGRIEDLKAFDGIPADIIDTWRKSGRIPGDMDDPVTWAENLAWLKERIARGDTFGIATDPSKLPPLVNGRIPGVANGYFTTKELAFLRKSGIDVLDLWSW